MITSRHDLETTYGRRTFPRAYGWNEDYSCHRLPGRLLIDVPALCGEPHFGGRLERLLRYEPRVRTVRADAVSGRVLIEFDEGVGDAARLWRAVHEFAHMEVNRASRPGSIVTSWIALRRHSADAFWQRVQRSVGGDSKFSWVRLNRRRELRCFGPRAFRAGRELQKRGEHVVCLMEKGRPVGLLGLRATHEGGAAPPGPNIPSSAVIAGSGVGTAASQVAAAVEADVTAPSWHMLSATGTMDVLGSRDAGLSQDEAALRLTRFGFNAFPRQKPPSAWADFLDQCKDPMALILVASAGLCIVLGQWVDAAIVAGIVIVNALLAVVQNGKARGSLDEFGPLRPTKAKVIRDGKKITVPVEHLVPGDIVHLESGDCVPADVRLLEGSSLFAVEAMLTGESEDVAKDAHTVLGNEAAVSDRPNMAFMGTFIRQGRGRGVVVGTGFDTEMGRIAAMLDSAEPGTTPLQRRLATVNRYVVIGAFVCSLIMVALGLMQGLPLGLLAITAVSTAVAAIPEGLPITVSVALAAAASRMRRRHALVRSLPSVETLGSTTVICTDKTGTLTQNRMSVHQIWTGEALYTLNEAGLISPAPPGSEGDLPPDLLFALRTATLCSNATIRVSGDGKWTMQGDPTEGALLMAAARAGVIGTTPHADDVRLHETPFDPAVRHMTVVCQEAAGDIIAHTKGAPDALMDMCAYYRKDGHAVRLDAIQRRRILAQAEQMAAGAQRVLAVAYKLLPATWNASSVEADLAGDMVFIGLFGLVDPLRPDVYSSLQKCNEAGIKVIMTTGDHPQTAAAIARQLGMMHDDDTLLTGADIDALDDERLFAALERTAVCARVTPEQKLRIVRLLQAQGHVVAMTGDGVNDAPAIRAADIGIAMGSTGAEITRAAADMELLEDNFDTIVHAVREGRGAFDNIRRTVRYTLATNIAEVVLMLGAVFIAAPLPLLPVHLLWINLVCDGLPALALAFDRPADECMERPPQRVDEGLFANGLWQRTIARGVALGLGTLLLFNGVLGFGGAAMARSAAMASLVAGKLIYLFQVRKRKTGNKPLQNDFLSRAVGLSAVLFLGTMYVPALQSIFGVVGLGAAVWLAVGAVTAAGTIVEAMTEKRLPCESRSYVSA